MNAPQVPIEVDEATGVWATDGLPMIYVPRHFFVNNHIEVEAALGRETYAKTLYTAGHRSAHFWCEQASKAQHLKGLDVYAHYLQRLSQRGWGQFRFDEVDATSGHARIRLEHSVFVLAQGIAGVPVVSDKACYLFAGWFSGAMDWVGADMGRHWKTQAEETRCAAEGHAHCVFTVRPLS